ncbi:MAG TPA: hypothetical protein VGZ50_02640, partial [Actinomycetota bacterium]|nr:hypothetical protein [Actinomycetota bacterium]
MSIGRKSRRTWPIRFSYLIPVLAVVSLLNAGIASVSLGQGDPGEQPAPTETTTPSPIDTATPEPIQTETAPEPIPTETANPEPAPTDPATTPATEPSPTLDPNPTGTSAPEPPPTESPATESAIDIPVLEPTISSDKPDYFAGETVTLTGSGWLSTENVQIVVNDDAGQSWRRDVVVSADISGGVVDTFTLPEWFVATYSVRATGLTSGAVATSSFTDTGGAYNIDLAAADPGDSPTYAKQSPAQFGPCPAPSGGAGVATD